MKQDDRCEKAPDALSGGLKTDRMTGKMKRETMRAWAEIDLGALVHNLEYAKKLTGRKVCAVIKGDAHGHGALKCAETLAAHGCDAFAVACLEEGIELREGGIMKPILVLGWTPAAFAPDLAEYRLTQSVLDEAYANELEEALSSFGGHLDVHVKIDTGMSRTGLFAQNGPGEAAEAILRIDKLPHLGITGIFTHYAAADVRSKDAFTAWQLENFKAVLARLEEKGFDRSKVTVHASNSACVLYHPETYFDMVRLGVMVYGFYPDDIFRPDGPLRQVLSLKARVAQVKELPAGSHVSYGCTFETSRPTTIAVVSAGYADAYPRILSNKGAYAVINGVKCPQIGRICMDLCMFDVTGADVKRSDVAILYGKGGIPLEEIAALAGSINCEPTSLLTKRVRKVYIEAEEA